MERAEVCAKALRLGAAHTRHTRGLVPVRVWHVMRQHCHVSPILDQVICIRGRQAFRGRRGREQRGVAKKGGDTTVLKPQRETAVVHLENSTPKLISRKFVCCLNIMMFKTELHQPELRVNAVV